MMFYVYWSFSIPHFCCGQKGGLQEKGGNNGICYQEIWWLIEK